MPCVAGYLTNSQLTNTMNVASGQLFKNDTKNPPGFLSGNLTGAATRCDHLNYFAKSAVIILILAPYGIKTD